MSSMQIPIKEYEQLKKNTAMLGQIATAVEEFCDEEDTTLCGVLRILERYYSMKAHEIEQWRLRELRRDTQNV